LTSDLGNRNIVEVVLHLLLEILEEFCSIIHRVALEHHHFVNFNKIFWVDAFLLIFICDKAKNFVDVFSLNDHLSFFKTLILLSWIYV
jgi:hypothetical protein